MNIDFVIFWVDGSDVEWQKKKALYKGTPFQNATVDIEIGIFLNIGLGL